MANWIKCSNGIWIDLDKATKIGNRKDKESGKFCIAVEYFEKEFIVNRFDKEEDAENEIKKMIK
jgi:hypothetical protein